MIGRTVRNWEADKTVAVAASGGVSHFVVDEEIGRRMLGAMLVDDLDALFAQPAMAFATRT